MEFDNINKTIKVVSEDYYIDNIKIVEYIQKENYIELIDSNYIEINKRGTIINNKIDLLAINKNYKTTGKPIKDVLKKKNIAFYIWIVNPKLKKKDTNYGALAEFVIDSISKKRIVFESNGGCK
ncbi:hypothetical protein [Flavobacterium sp. MDT1-60]|uniref:hypothetical protein n=1 Tax=Flavobacterium sp. MDT1-60 TaxID=1979344 RepID=UPI00177DF6C4|nr:hypothetical protein [Flavobacterium sp. MDT1-60]QOG03666.1 hypothetical protein IHE43_05395 [Flavobacterium sp. MDT1-60]